MKKQENVTQNQEKNSFNRKTCADNLEEVGINGQKRVLVDW